VRENGKKGEKQFHTSGSLELEHIGDSGDGEVRSEPARDRGQQ
jgi:hypothetical protein